MAANDFQNQDPVQGHCAAGVCLQNPKSMPGIKTPTVTQGKEAYLSEERFARRAANNLADQDTAQGRRVLRRGRGPPPSPQTLPLLRPLGSVLRQLVPQRLPRLTWRLGMWGPREPCDDLRRWGFAWRARLLLAAICTAMPHSEK